MSEWWTYSLADFLMFAPRTWYRLIELYNLAIWPAQIAALGIGGVILVLLYRGGPAGPRVIAGLLALAWAWVAYGFLLTRYDAINWAGRYIAVAFAAQAVLLAVPAMASRTLFLPSRDIAARLGISLFLFALIGYPLLAPVLGRTWQQAELFGLAPDPTALGTLGLVLTLRGSALLLMPLPLLWCAFSGAQLAAMQAPEAFLLPAIALLTLVTAVWRGNRA